MPRRSMQAGLMVWCALAAPAFANSCEGLMSVRFPDAKVTAAQTVAAGSFKPPAGGSATVYARLPEFCRAALTLTPSSDSDIKAEVWLPAEWNQKLQAVGNGGWAGTISYATMAEAVKSCYATASTDTGHSTSGGSFALGHPDKLIQFSSRHEPE